jgi:hypothetical protein
MHPTVLAVYEEYRLVRHEPSGEARVEHVLSDRASGWLNANEVTAIRAKPASMPGYVNEALDETTATNEAR